MDLEFKVYKVKEDSESYKWLYEMGINEENEFIVVGEEDDYYKVLQLRDSSLSLFSDMRLDIMASKFKKEDLKLSGDGVGIESAVFSIPKKNLTLDLIEDILRLNEI
jgi:hypothetical protein